MLPDQSFAVALILDDGGKAVALDLLGFQALRHIVDMVADGTYVGGCTLGGTQTHAALTAGEFHGLVLLCHGVDGFAADRALGLRALALVKDHMVPAVGTGAACQLVRADIDGAAAGTVDFLSCKEPGLCFRVAPAVGTFNDKFRHNITPQKHNDVHIDILFLETCQSCYHLGTSLLPWLPLDKAFQPKEHHLWLIL